MGSAIFIKNTGTEDFLIHETMHFAFKLKRFLILIHLEKYFKFPLTRIGDLLAPGSAHARTSANKENILVCLDY